jgi:hypothetical protein
MRYCRKCGEYKPADTKHFYRDRYRPDGLSAYCKVCRAGHQKEYLQRPGVKQMKRSYHKEYSQKEENRVRSNTLSRERYASLKEVKFRRDLWEKLKKQKKRVEEKNYKKRVRILEEDKSALVKEIQRLRSFLGTEDKGYPIKLCKKCGTEYPATKEFFHVDSTKPDGWAYYCKRCKSGIDGKYLDSMRVLKRLDGDISKKQFKEELDKLYQENDVLMGKLNVLEKENKRLKKKVHEELDKEVAILKGILDKKT